MSNVNTRIDAPVLAHSVLAGNREPDRWLYVLHGIYGAGRNWATVARRTIELRPEWGAVLVDLRQHGASQGFPPPHTIEAAAADLHRLEESTGRPAGAVLGHSFGGKVALQWSLETAAPHQAWIIDSTPQAGEAAGSAWRMLETIRALPHEFGSRTEGIEALERAGIEKPTAQWMATNLERSKDSRLHWRFDLASIEALLRDFFSTDLWNAVESAPPEKDLHFVKATESSVLSGPALERLERIAARRPNVHLHVIEGGHWLNADNPGAVIDLLAPALGEWPASGV